MKQILCVLLLLLVIQLKYPIRLPNENNLLGELKIKEWKWSEPALRHRYPSSLVFEYNGKKVYIPFDNIKVFWEE